MEEESGLFGEKVGCLEEKAEVWGGSGLLRGKKEGVLREGKWAVFLGEEVGCF